MKRCQGEQEGRPCVRDKFYETEHSAYASLEVVRAKPKKLVTGKESETGSS
jgi:hypothetical protein